MHEKTSLRGLLLRPAVTFFIFFVFIINSFGPLPQAQADGFFLPAPGTRVSLSPEYNPPLLKGIKVDPDNPFRFDFILDQGDGLISGRPFHEDAARLIKYFLASLTVPENDLWVNLSPYEKNRIIPQSFGLTEMGRDLLAQDYILKQITASLIYPESQLGKKFWKRIYEEAYKKFGTTDIPVNTFNKVWVIPEKSVVYENPVSGAAFIVESRLKVMLEEDYLSLQYHSAAGPSMVSHNMNALGTPIVREIVIPELTQEVNEGRNFAYLRQVYDSLILATWYKKKIKDSILGQVYADKNKVKGLSFSVGAVGNPQNIYQKYLQAFKKGVYNYIKEDPDPISQVTVMRKYFSGGFGFEHVENSMIVNSNQAMLNKILNRLPTGIKEHLLKIRINLIQWRSGSNKPVDQSSGLDAGKVPLPGSDAQAYDHGAVQEVLGNLRKAGLIDPENNPIGGNPQSNPSSSALVMLDPKAGAQQGVSQNNKRWLNPELMGVLKRRNIVVEHNGGWHDNEIPTFEGKSTIITFIDDKGQLLDRYNFLDGVYLSLVGSQVGPLIFLTKEFFDSLDLVDRKKLKKRVILFPKDIFILKWHNYSTAIMFALIKSNIKGSHVIDSGAGNGCLALAALKLGASFVHLVDKDEKELNEARRILILNGYKEARDDNWSGKQFQIHLGDIRDRDFIQKIGRIAGGMARKAKKSLALISDIGLWSNKGWLLRMGESDKGPRHDGLGQVSNSNSLDMANAAGDVFNQAFLGGYSYETFMGNKITMFHDLEDLKRMGMKTKYAVWSADEKHLPLVLVGEKQSASLLTGPQYPQPKLEQAMSAWQPVKDLPGILVNSETGRIKFAGKKPIVKLLFNFWAERHGETRAVHEGRLQGNVNTLEFNQLTADGIHHAGLAADQMVSNEDFQMSINDHQPVVVITSELTRTQDTAKPFIQKFTAAGGLIETVPANLIHGANEISFGIAENKNESDLKDTLNEAILQKYRNGLDATAKFEGGESFIDLLIRVKQWLEEINLRYAGRTVVLFGHGSFLSAVKILLGDQQMEDPAAGFIDWRKKGNMLEPTQAVNLSALKSQRHQAMKVKDSLAGEIKALERILWDKTQGMEDRDNIWGDFNYFYLDSLRNEMADKEYLAWLKGAVKLVDKFAFTGEQAYEYCVNYALAAKLRMEDHSGKIKPINFSPTMGSASSLPIKKSVLRLLVPKDLRLTGQWLKAGADDMTKTIISNARDHFRDNKFVIGIISDTAHGARLEGMVLLEDVGEAVYLRNIVIAPWNREEGPDRQLKGVGSVLAAAAIQESFRRGYQGRLFTETSGGAVKLFEQLGAKEYAPMFENEDDGSRHNGFFAKTALKVIKKQNVLNGNVKLTNQLPDFAMKQLGGIDLTPAHMNVQVKSGFPIDAFADDKGMRTGDDKGMKTGNDLGIKFHLGPAMLASLQNAPGFVPVIINIEPLGDLRAFLGINEQFKGEGIKV